MKAESGQLYPFLLGSFLQAPVLGDALSAFFNPTYKAEATMKEVELFYDFRSPYAYFASQRLALLTDVGAAIIWKPVSASILINLQAGRDPKDEVIDPLCPPKRAHFMADIFRLIEYWRIPFAVPQPTPPVCDLAMIIATQLDAEGVDHDRFRMCIFEAVWQQQKDANDPDVVRECLETSGLAAELVDAAKTDSGELWTENTVTAFNAGVFGVPTFRFGDDIYFGADRMELLATRL